MRHRKHYFEPGAELSAAEGDLSLAEADLSLAALALNQAAEMEGAEGPTVTKMEKRIRRMAVRYTRAKDRVRYVEARDQREQRN